MAVKILFFYNTFFKQNLNPCAPHARGCRTSRGMAGLKISPLRLKLSLTE